MRFALFFMAEYINMVTVCALAATLFLGGYHLPCFAGAPAFVCNPPWFVSILVILAKILVGMFLFVWLRATLPRLRYDQLMDFGWKVLLPLALVNLALTAIGIVAYQNGLFG
jgi:NADH-quinone oxidoreductase subunit H